LFEFTANMMSAFFTNCKGETPYHFYITFFNNLAILNNNTPLKESLLFCASDFSTGDKVLDYLDPASRTDYIKAVFILSSLEAKGIKVAHY